MKPEIVTRNCNPKLYPGSKVFGRYPIDQINQETTGRESVLPYCVFVHHPRYSGKTQT